MPRSTLREWLSRFLFTHVPRQTTPDQRPLYAYRCEARDYGELGELVRKHYRDAHDMLAWPQVFCLFAAETFRRRHEGGVWQWATIFDSLDAAVPSHALLAEWVKKGLKWWGRDLIISKNGNHEFLVTIACEGGLPLLLLHRENATLLGYFKDLLRTYHRQQERSQRRAVELARQHMVKLPKSLCHPPVDTLSGQLIHEVVLLQAEVPDAQDSIEELDAKDTKWRRRLPLPLEDRTIDLLLHNLVNEAKVLAKETACRARWRCCLAASGNERYRLERHLELPSQVDEPAMQRWTGTSNPVPRRRLWLEVKESARQIALYTHFVGNDSAYALEWLVRDGVKLHGQVAALEPRLWFTDGEAEIDFQVEGDSALGDLPWVFAERSNPSTLEFLGQGSVKSRSALVWVAPSPEGGEPAIIDGSCEPVGSVLDRMLFAVCGTVEFDHPEFGLCRVQSDAPNDEGKTYTLRGQSLALATGNRAIFVGAPHWVAVQADGSIHGCSNVKTEWRPIGDRNREWRDDLSLCAGRVWLRAVDSSGILVGKQLVDVAPASIVVNMQQIGGGETPGVMSLNGLAGATVSAQALEHGRCVVESEFDGVSLQCTARPDAFIDQLTVELGWADGRQLEVTLPFPFFGAGFVQGARALPPSCRVALGRLSAIRAQVRAPAGVGRFWLRVRICARTRLSAAVRERRIKFILADGGGAINLYHYQDLLASMLSLTGELDAYARLDILDGQEQRLNRLEIARFDVALKPDADRTCVYFDAPWLLQEGGDWRERLHVQMLSLWDPGADAVPLQPAVIEQDEYPKWSIPSDLEAGPWWVMGLDGDWARFRPLLWTVSGEADPCDCPLAEAIRISDAQERRQKLDNLMDSLSKLPDHPAWMRLFAYLPLVRDYPASAIDPLAALIRHPQTLATALFKAAEEQFEALWSLSDSLPFSWHLLPVDAWHAAARTHFDHLRVQLGSIDPDGEILFGEFNRFRRLAERRQAFFKSLCDWLHLALFPDVPLHGSELQMAQTHEGFLMGLIAAEEQQLQGRHDAEERYPEGEQIMAATEQSEFPQAYRYLHLARPYRPVRSAPFLAAHLSLFGQPYSPELLFQLRLSRDFDLEWFDTAFAYALCLGLAQRQG